MLYLPIIGAYMLIMGIAGQILIAIGRAFRWVMLVMFFYLALFEVSMADEPKWLLVFIKDGEIVEYGEPHASRRDCVRLGYMHIFTELQEQDEPRLDGFFCDRTPPLEEQVAEIPVCTGPARQCS